MIVQHLRPTPTSSPVSRTTETLAAQGFPLLFGLRYPHGTPTGFLEVWVWFGYGSQGIKKFLHPVRTLPPHGFCHMGVTVQRKCRGIVSGILLDRFYVIPGPEGIHHIGVPLGYNNDKTGNPYGTRVLSDSGC